MTTFVLLAAADSRDLELRIDAGLHPRLEYLELRRRHKAEIVDFDTTHRWRVSAWIARHRLLGPYWGLSVFSARHHGRDDVVIATGEDIGFRAMMMHAVLRRPRNRPQLAILVHGSYLDSRKFGVLARVIRRMHNLRLLCLSESIAGELERQGVPVARLSVVGYGVDTHFFRCKAAESPDEPTSILAAGTANRDYATLVQAVSDSATPVRIAADSAWFREPLNLDGVLVPDNVEIKSSGDYVGLRSLYAQARLVVVPLRQSRRASGYAVILEAMAMGRPVISTATAGRSDFIRDGETGLLITPGDSAELTRAIADLLGDQPKATRFAETALRLIVENNTVEHYTDRIARAAGIV